MAKNLNNNKKYIFMLFQKLTFTLRVKMKEYFFLKKKLLLLLLFMISAHKNKKRSYILILFFLSVTTPCVIYLNIVRFMQSKLKELQLLFPLENYLS